MNSNVYQKLAARTIPTDKSRAELTKHALFGMCGETGEIQSMFQKQIQGHDIVDAHLMKEVGDLLWFVAEFCTMNDWEMGDIMAMNIEKLKARFPDGFEIERSIHRAEGDV